MGVGLVAGIFLLCVFVVYYALWRSGRRGDF